MRRVSSLRIPHTHPLPRRPSESERAFNAALTAEIERLGFTVFLPQRDEVNAIKAPWALFLSLGERATHLMTPDLIGGN